MNAKKQRRRSGGGGGSRRLTKAKAKRKPKYLSLRRQFPANEKDRLESTKRRRLSHDAEGDEGGGGGGCLSKGIDLVPVDRPEEEEEEDEIEHRDGNDQENDVARFFSAGDGGATSLSVLLDDSSNAGVASCSSEMNNSSSRLDDLSPSSASLTYAYNDGRRRAALVRHALRSRERGSGQEEEKWVCYSKVVERKQVVKEELEVTSSSSRRAAGPIRRLSLKLDYQEIMNAWSDKGPLYIDAAAESSQVVPDVNDDHRSVGHEPLNNGLSWGCNMGVWTVPEMVGDVQKGETRANKDEEQETRMMGQREASVLRYKEKRQNRLFSKTIRYQVRKLNAEKRPRIKGRFVKRD